MSREPDLSFIQSDISLEDVRPLETKKLALVINEFLLRTADVLNSFSAKMEQKLLEIEDRLDLLETHLFLTEKKLETIEQIPNEPISQLEQVTKTEITASVEMPSMTPPTCDVQQVSQQSLFSTEPSSNIVENKEQKNSIKISEHLMYSKYFKMLKMGVPEPGVKQKMIQEGVDPELLNDPNKMMVVQSKNEASSDGNDSDSSFSSDE